MNSRNLLFIGAVPVGLSLAPLCLYPVEQELEQLQLDHHLQLSTHHPPAQPSSAAVLSGGLAVEDKSLRKSSYGMILQAPPCRLICFLECL